jgi:hypothetical protein
MRSACVLLLSGLLVIQTSCGGDSTSAANQMTREELTQVCDGIAYHWAACDSCLSTTHEGCVEECIDYLEHRRADGIREVAPCLETLGCYEFLIVCWDGIEPIGVHDDWSDACFARTDCGFDDGDCNVDRIRTYAANVTDQLSACFDEDCAAVQDCLDAVFDATEL